MPGRRRHTTPDGMAADALGRLTVVVPVGPGEAPAPALATALRGLPRATELRLVCASAADAAALGTLVAADDGPRFACRVAERGRALQQNAGAFDAGRPWLWFLHVDSLPAPTTLPALAAFLRRDEPALGFFDLCFHDGPALMAVNAAGAWIRSRWLGLPFGDQGLVVPRAAFVALGGFDPALARGEDHDLVWRARRTGLPLRPIGAPLSTSARRYAVHGWWRTTAEHLGETWRQARRFARAADGR